MEQTMVNLAELCGSLGVFVALLPLALAVSDAEGGANYDESKVPAYTLPDPLVMADGTKVTSAEMWRTKRRPEILELFRSHVYGRSPGKPDGMTFKVFDNDPKALDGKATRRQVTVLFTGKDDGPKMDLLLYLPNDAKKPVPAFLLLNFAGNHAICSDPAITLPTGWVPNGKGRSI